MRIIITQAEIELAIREHVLGQLSIKEGQQITVAFKNTRGDDGATAEIDITNPQQGQQTTSAPTTKSAPSVAPIASHGTHTIQSSSAEVAEELQAVHAAEAAQVAENPSLTSAAQSATAGNTSATEEVSSAEPASTTTDQTTSSEPVAGNVEITEDIPRTVPFDADQPVDQEVVSEAPKPVVKSLFANLKPPINAPKA